MIESERSFLAKDVPTQSVVSFRRIVQHYLSDGRDPLRLRHAESADGVRRELTKKLAVTEDDMSRKEEINIPLSADEYAMLLPLAKRGLEKTRREIPLEGGLMAEVDYFHGPLEGLVKIEVEFADEAARASFAPPDWFGREITDESWSKNANLAGRKLAEIADRL